MKKGLIVLKGAREGLRVIMDDIADFSTVLAELDRTIKSADDFFNGAQVIIELGQRKITEKQIKQLENLIMKEHGLGLRRITGYGYDLKYFGKEKEENYKELGTEMKDIIKNQQQFNTSLPETTDALLIKRTLRSGQRISFAGDVVVLGDVNAGAEIIAGGDIIVMGTLRGVAHAGASGNSAAIVAAFRLLPMQLRIANYISRSPDEDLTRPIEPEVARIKDERIVDETYIPNKDSYANYA